ncbi:MAG: hypothetical protein M3416_09690 [Acidobacteriota bacterium]|nr:hypothetical protein [Acidobacteriota bacterium]
MTSRIADFLDAIGIEVVPARLEGETFLPGILVSGGKLLVDEEKLTYPGDLLHEAGHLAVVPGSLRAGLGGVVNVPGMDMAAVEVLAVAWSYAAARHLDIDLRVVFHEGGYKGKSEGLVFTFGVGVYPGASGLQEAGMTAASGDLARRLGVPAYPHMLKWLRD